MRVLIFDIEANNLDASWGRLLCCSFAVLGEEEAYTFRGDKRPYKERDLVEDGKLAVAIRNELEKADIIIGWNSILYDVPFINARLDRIGERPIRVGEKHGTFHLDAMYYVGGQSMRIGGRKLDTAAKFFGLKNQKTPLDGDAWQRAAVGDKKSMNLIVDHCESDVKALREAFPHIAPHVKKIQFNLSEVWPFIEDIPSRRN